MSNVHLRKMDVDSEPMKNCVLCDCVSTSLECKEMYEMSTSDFEPNSVKEKPRVHICWRCMMELTDLMI